MEAVWLEVETRDLVVGDFDRFLVPVAVERGLDAQPRPCPRAPDQAHDRLDALQRSATPVLGDVAEHSVLDLVPLARAGRVVRDCDVESGLVREALQLQFPEPRAVAVASAAIGGHKQPSGVGIGPSPHSSPPTAEGLDRELGRVVVDADVDPALVPSDVSTRLAMRTFLGVADSLPLSDSDATGSALSGGRATSRG